MEISTETAGRDESMPNVIAHMKLIYVTIYVSERRPSELYVNF